MSFKLENKLGKACATGKDRLRWTPSLERAFETAVRKTGGMDSTSPSAICEEMWKHNLTTGQIKSHLQKLRRDRFRPENAPRARSPAKSVVATEDVSIKLEEEMKKNIDFEC